MEGLPAALDRLSRRAGGAAHLVPGPGDPGGLELISLQRRYHDEVARLVRSAPSEEAAAAAVLAAFPGRRLEVAIGSAAERLRGPRAGRPMQVVRGACGPWGARAS